MITRMHFRISAASTDSKLQLSVQIKRCYKNPETLKQCFYKPNYFTAKTVENKVHKSCLPQSLQPPYTYLPLVYPNVENPKKA
jgi:hypothetical protein